MVETTIEQLHEAWDVHSCLFNVKTSRKEEGMIALTYALCRSLKWCAYSNLSRHIKERQNGIYCLNFLKKIALFERWDLVSYPK